MIEDLKALIGSNEKILYQGKPDKKCYIFKSIFNPVFPIELLSLILIFELIVVTLGFAFENFLYSTIVGMLICSIPGFMCLCCILFIFKKYKNTVYVITDKAIYVSSGVFMRNIKTKPFAELSHINLHIDFFDQIFKVGNIIATTNHLAANGRSRTIIINSISNYIEIYNLVKKLQTDIYTDIMYPNDKRHADNSEYNTKYKG